MTEQTFTQTLVIVSCGHKECEGSNFGMERGFYDARRTNHDAWWCPRGHRRYYTGESNLETAERLRKEAQVRASRALARALAAEDQAAAAERSARAVRGHLTRQRRRAAHGVCPVCPRTFANVEQHVARQHPDYVEALRPTGGGL